MKNGFFDNQFKKEMIVMSVLSKIDDILIDKLYQKFAWWFQKMTGRTNFWLAEASCNTFTLSVIAIAGRGLASEKVTLFWIVTTFVVMVAIFAFEIIKENIRRDEKYFFEKTDSGMNHFRITGFTGRMMSLLVASILAINDLATFLLSGGYLQLVLNALFDISFVSIYYFLSCTPLPPCKGLVKEWLEARKKKLKLASAEAK